jgi:O-antigen/teichoic acid export membrane protein
MSAVLNFGANLILIPYFGIIGAALTTLLAFLFAFAVTAAYSLRHFKFDVNGGFILKSVGASILMSVLLLLLGPSGLASVLLSISLATAIYLSILFALKGLTVDDIKFFYSIFERS